MQRGEVSFQSGGTQVAGWLFTPGGPGPHACVILGHGFGAVREARLDSYAERFAAAGLASLVFDYRHFGNSAGTPRQLLDVGRQLEDWKAALSYARSHKDLDSSRLALWGTSFSGGHVVRVAAEDGRVRAVVSQVPFADGLATMAQQGPITSARLLAAGIGDEIARLRASGCRRVKIVGAPGELACMTSPDAEPGYRALLPADTEWVNEVCARIVLRIPTYRPLKHAERVGCPVLVCVCDRDVICPPIAAWKLAGLCPRGEIRRFAGGHFDIYFGQNFETAVADQTGFLCRHLHVGTDQKADSQSIDSARFGGA